jgi:putative FmdB family regulatory protein
MIIWKFKCNKCGYKFTASTPVNNYDACTKCTQCGSLDYLKSKSTIRTMNTTQKDK